jgi:hypothetical protein
MSKRMCGLLYEYGSCCVLRTLKLRRYSALAEDVHEERIDNPKAMPNC